MARRIEVELPSEFSDGSSSRWPAGDYVWAPTDTFYVERLADLEKGLIEGSKTGDSFCPQGSTGRAAGASASNYDMARKIALEGERYVFKKLPEGYRTYTKPREDGRHDRYIFGHAKGRFDSPNKFAVHFKWLMHGGVGNCNCVHCKGRTMRNSSLQPVVPAVIISEPDVNNLSAQLERFANYFGKNPDTAGEYRVAWEGSPPGVPHELLDEQSFETIAAKYRTLPSFLPRKGELVLFHLDDGPDCRFDDITQQLKIANEASGESSGFPSWRAGVVAVEPKEKLNHKDLCAPPQDHLEVIGKSFRIELYPDPDSRDKSFSNEVHEVQLHLIRPLSMFHEILSGVPQIQWHKSIHNSLKSMNTACLVDPIEFVGKWFSYSLRCRGIWVGPELYVKGDAVRLFPATMNGSDIDQIMIINRIDHRFENGNVYDERSSIVVAGPVITVNKTRSLQNTPLTVAEERELLLPASTTGYTWYPIDVSTNGRPPESNYQGFLDDWQEVPLSYIVGRLYDSETMKVLLNVSNFDVGGLGVKKARRWAKKHRTCMKVNAHQEWILAVDRVKALDIETLNGRAVGKGVEEQNLTGRNGSRQSIGVSSGRSQKGKNRFSGAATSQTSDKYSSSGWDDEDGQERADALLTKDVAGCVHSDSSGQRTPSFESVVTDHTHNWSQDKDEDANAENFISDIIAENMLITEEDEDGEDGDIADELQDGVSASRERPAKRPRLQSQ